MNLISVEKQMGRISRPAHLGFGLCEARNVDFTIAVSYYLFKEKNIGACFMIIHSTTILINEKKIGPEFILWHPNVFLLISYMVSKCNSHGMCLNDFLDGDHIIRQSYLKITGNSPILTVSEFKTVIKILKTYNIAKISKPKNYRGCISIKFIDSSIFQEVFCG